VSRAASIKAAAKVVAQDLFTFYPQRPDWWFIGLLDLPPPDGQIHWWISGSFWATLLDYRHATGDTQYDKAISDALLFQVGEFNDYLPRNWTSGIGNDDQAFWALNTMIAAETNFPDPPSDKPQWLAIVQAVFNEQMLPDRRAPPSSNCRSGIRWQRQLGSTGYIYINTISNSCFMNLGVRLGRYTANQTYVDEAVKIGENMFRLGYIDNEFNVYDGAHIDTDCKAINQVQYSYNIAMVLQNSAYMYNAVSFFLVQEML
jgi:mannan endo-1,6-alpha-mannosidase